MNTYFGNSFVETSLLAPSITGEMIDYSRKGFSIVMNHAVDRGLMRTQDNNNPPTFRDPNELSVGMTR